MTATADLIQRGMQHHAERRFHQAWWCYEAAAEQEPESPFVWMARGDLANDLLRFGEAITCYDRALGYVPQSPMILEKRTVAQQNHDEPRVSEGKGFAGSIKRMFSGGPKWTPALVNVIGAPTELDMLIRRSEFGEVQGLLTRVVDAGGPRVDTSNMTREAAEAVSIQQFRPSNLQPVADDVLVYKLKRTLTVKESKLIEGEIELKNFTKTEDVLNKALRIPYDMLLLSDADKLRDSWLRAHTDFMRLEARHPGLGEAIWTTRGRDPFGSGKIGEAIAGEKERLARLDELNQRDATGFVESLVAWLG